MDDTTDIATTTDLLAELLAEYHDRRDGLPTAPSITVEVTYTRERVLIVDDTYEVWTLTTTFGNARGLVWLEDDLGGRVISSAELSRIHPEAMSHPELDRRATDR